MARCLACSSGARRIEEGWAVAVTRGASGAVYSVVAVVASAGVFAHSGGFAPGGAFQYVVFLLFALWMLVLSLWLLTRMGAESGTTAMAGERPMATTS